MGRLFQNSGRKVSWEDLHWNKMCMKLVFGTSLACLISNFRRVLNVVCFLLGYSPESEFCVPTFRNTICSIFIGRWLCEEWIRYIREGVWLEISLAFRKVGDRVGEGSEYRNRLWRVTTHMSATGRYEEKGARQTIVFYVAVSFP